MLILGYNIKKKHIILIEKGLSVSKRLVDYHMSRLKDKSPEARLKAIQELVLLEDISALDALQEIFKTDPDEEVRKAAQHAGREIFLKAKAKEKESGVE